MLHNYVITALLAIASLDQAQAVDRLQAVPPNETSLWSPVLQILNQDPGGGFAASSPFTHLLSDDLTAIYQKEIGSAKTAIRRELALAKGKTRAEKVLAENIFLHQRANELNADAFATLRKASASHAKQKLDYKRIALEVLKEVAKNPVARLESTHNFPQGGQIGFCFGRALLTHYLLLKAGVPQTDLAKIFSMGDLLVEGTLWRFHVAVLVKDSGFGYLVVDPMHERPLPYEQWLEINKRYSVKKELPRVRFYVTDPRKFLPSFAKYSEEQLSHEVLRSYFDQLVKTIPVH